MGQKMIRSVQGHEARSKIISKAGLHHTGAEEKMSKIVRETQAKLSHKNIHIETKIKMVHRLRAGVNAAKLRPRRAQEIPSKSQMERVHKHMTGIKVWVTP